MKNMKKIIIYTCIVNDYDWLLPPVWKSKKVSFICFTDNTDMEPNGWDLRSMPKNAKLESGTHANRYCKFFPWEILPKHEWSLYIDANIRLISDPSPILADIEEAGAEIAIPTHPHRSNIWQEAEACKRFGKLSTTNDVLRLEAQLERYRESGLNTNNGLTENNIIFRSGNSEKLFPVMEKWWQEFLSGVPRDQISLPYILWSTDTKIYRLPFSSRDLNPYFRIVPHRGSGKLGNYLQARQFHGFKWNIAFKLFRIYSVIGRYTVKIY